MDDATIRIRLHQPLWGGFPMHWVYGSAKSFKLTTEEEEAWVYTSKEANKIEMALSRKYPNAVINRSDRG